MKRLLVVLVFALALLLALGHWIPRTAFVPFIGSYAGLFILYAYWWQGAPKLFQAAHWPYYLGVAVLLRLTFGMEMPALSDDFWRYLWDGRLLSHGVNPYQWLPSELLQTPIYEQANLGQLYPHLNSPDYYSVYPPLTQLLFAAATFCFPNSVVASVLLLRVFIIIIEIGTIILLVRYLQQHKKPVYWTFVYAFNPLIILELSGNLHTESLMLLGLIILLYHWSKKQWYRSALGATLAVGAKLIPLMLLPLLCWRLWRRGTHAGKGWEWNARGFSLAVGYGLLVLVPNAVLFSLFYDWAMLQKIRASMALYFQHFEFNASVYYFLRYQVLQEYWRLWDYHDYFMGVYYIEEALRLDWYMLLRRVLPVISLLGIVGIALRHRSVASVANGCLWIFALYFVMGTTIHPWYISTLVLLAVLTNYTFPLVWSAMIGATYISYQGGSFEEQTWVIILEYGVVGAVLYWEWYQNKHSKIAQYQQEQQKTTLSST